MQLSEKTLKIRELNDQFRRTGMGGSVNITQGIAEMPRDDVCAIMNSLKKHDEFSEDNDPHGEHDFGSFHFKDTLYFWKIDYYDQTFQTHSPDATNPKLTNRVLTVMRADEY